MFEGRWGRELECVEKLIMARVGEEWSDVPGSTRKPAGRHFIITPLKMQQHSQVGYIYNLSHSSSPLYFFINLPSFSPRIPQYTTPSTPLSYSLFISSRLSTSPNTKNKTHQLSPKDLFSLINHVNYLCASTGVNILEPLILTPYSVYVYFSPSLLLPLLISFRVSPRRYRWGSLACVVTQVTRGQQVAATDPCKS